MSDEVRSGSSLRAELTELIETQPLLNDASKSSRRTARDLTSGFILGSESDEPVTVEEARQRLEGIANHALSNPTAKKRKLKSKAPGLAVTRPAAEKQVIHPSKGHFWIAAIPLGGRVSIVGRIAKGLPRGGAFRVGYQSVDLDKLAEVYPRGGRVTVADLVAKGVVRKNGRVKVLGTGDLKVKLDVTVDRVTESAEEKILAAGGTVIERAH